MPALDSPAVPSGGYLFPRAHPELAVTCDVSLIKLSKVGFPDVFFKGTIFQPDEVLWTILDGGQFNKVVKTGVVLQFAITMKITELELS